MEPAQTRPADFLYYIPLKIYRPFGNQDSGSAHSDAYIERQVTGVAAHDLYHRATLMGLHGIPQLIDTLDGGVTGSTNPMV